MEFSFTCVEEIAAVPWLYIFAVTVTVSPPAYRLLFVVRAETVKSGTAGVRIDNDAVSATFDVVVTTVTTACRLLEYASYAAMFARMRLSYPVAEMEKLLFEFPLFMGMRTVSTSPLTAGISRNTGSAG